jgi:hypothetical protein
MRARVRPALVPKRAGAGPAGPEAKCRGVGRVPAQIWLGASPVPVQIWESGEGDTSGKGPGCSTRASMHLASIAGAPCCDHTACGAAFGPGADVGGVSHAQAPAVERMRPVALPNTGGGEPTSPNATWHE